MSLSSFVYGCVETQRIERKFQMSKGQSDLARIILLNSGFRVQFPVRVVKSIYYDDIDFSALRDNIDGVPNRDKLRLRYYNNSFDSAKVEIKHKRNNIGFKSTFKLSDNMVSESRLIAATNEWCYNNVLNLIRPTAFVKYSREYFSNGKLRATIDTAIYSGRLVGESKILGSLQNYSVVEFKYPPDRDDQFRNYYKNSLNSIALRNTKCSKYSNALMF